MEDAKKTSDLTVEGKKEVPAWYQDISLEHAESYIAENMRAAARNVIAIGYYLKCIRDGKLYEEAGFQNIWDYAREKYGFSMSTASRYMSRNDKFSKGGNSPIMDERYRDYNKSQLQEMLSLDAEQLEQVTPDMTAREIREMKRPREIPYYEIPGQEEMTDIPGVVPDTSGQTVLSAEDFGTEPEAVSEPMPAEPEGEKEPQSGSAVLTIDDFAVAEEKESVATSQEDEKYSSCPPGIRKCIRLEWGIEPEQQAAGHMECVACWNGFEISEMNTRENREHKDAESEIVLEPAAETQQNEENCCENSSERKLQWNTEDAYNVRRRYCGAVAKKFIRTFRDWMLEDFSNRVQDVIASEQEFKQRFRVSGCSWYFADPDNEEKAAHVNLFDDYIQFWDGNGQSLGNCEWFYLCVAVQSMWNVVALEDAEQSPTETPSEIQEKELLEEWEAAGLDAESFYEEDGDVIDAEFTESESEEAISDLMLLKDLLRSKDDLLRSNLMIPGIEPDDIHIRRQKLEVAALASMLCELETMEEEPEHESQEQPELPVFRNNEERKDWLNNYAAWGLWYEDEHIGARYYKYDFPDGTRLIVDEYESILPGGRKYKTSYMHLVGGPEERPKTTCGAPKWPYHDRYNRHPDNMTDMVEFLKDLQKRGEM